MAKKQIIPPVEEKTPKAYVPSDIDAKTIKYLSPRIVELKEFRKNQLIEKDWKEADDEYIPSKLEIAETKRFETDQDTGLRSRMVKINSDKDSWRSDISNPVLLTKIQTAMAIIIDRNPEAILTALTKKYEKTTALANSIWKRNWEITKSKELIKLLTFDCAKYGWAAGRTFPQIIKYNKKVLTSTDKVNKTYENKELVLFNDVNKMRLDPKRVWIDEMTMPYNELSMNDVYYELDYSYDTAKVEFGQYPNFEFVGRSAKVEIDEQSKQGEKEDKKERKDIITVGFYENRLKDLQIIWIPSKKIILDASPLPNDDGMLSVWHFPWIIKSASSPYGTSLWQIIKGKKELYDKMTNMTMDQLVLSIYKMFFYTGTTDLFGNGQIKIEPGKGVQIQNGEMKWMEVPGPGVETWNGLEKLKSEIDDDSGIIPTLEGEITGKTLGEILHAKEASLKRLKVPVENIAWGIEQDAYLTLSWSKQVLSTPEIKEFATAEDLMAYEKENETKHDQLFGKLNAEGQIDNYKASFMPEVSLHLEDRNGELFESKDTRYFQIGQDIESKDLEWKGIFKVVTKSLLAPSEELEAQRKSQMFNLLVPILQLPPELYAKSAIQLCKSNEEDEKDWLPDVWLQMMQTKEQQLFVQNPMMQAMQGMMGGQPGQAGGQNQSMENQAGTAPNPGGPTVVPSNQIQPNAQVNNLLGQ